MRGKPIRLEIAAEAAKSHVFYGDEDISGVVREISVVAKAGDATRVRLDCFKPGFEPWVIEGILLEQEPETPEGARS